MSCGAGHLVPGQRSNFFLSCDRKHSGLLVPGVSDETPALPKQKEVRPVKESSRQCLTGQHPFLLTFPLTAPKHSLNKFFWTTDSMRPAVAVSVLLLVRVLPLEAATRLARTKFSAHTGYIRIA